MRAARFLTKQLCHDRVRRNATTNRVAMLAVVRIDVIIRFKASTETDNSRFLTKIKMAIATYASPVVHLTSFFLKVADKHHFIIVVEQSIPVFTLWQRGRSLLTQGGSITCIRLLLSIHRYYDPGGAGSVEAKTSPAPQRGQLSGCSSLCVTSPHTLHTQRSAPSLTRSARLTMPTNLPWSSTIKRLMRS